MIYPTDSSIQPLNNRARCIAKTCSELVNNFNNNYRLWLKESQENKWQRNNFTPYLLLDIAEVIHNIRFRILVAAFLVLGLPILICMKIFQLDFKSFNVLNVKQHSKLLCLHELKAFFGESKTLRL